MDEAFYVFLAVVAVAAVTIAPLVSMFIGFGLRARLKRLAGELATVRRELRELKQPGWGRTAPESRPAAAAAARESRQEAGVPDVAPEGAPPAAGAAPMATAVPPPLPADAASGHTMHVEKTVAPASISADVTPDTAAVECVTAEAPPPPVSEEPFEVYTAPTPQREPSAFEANARKILAGIWNWVIVGEEYRSRGVSVEYAVATNWLMRFGVLIVLIGMGFFIRFAGMRGWVNDQGRIGIALLVGAGLITGGLHLLKGRYRLVGQGLMGAGLTILYGSIFAAYTMYSLIGMGLSFGLMAAVTAGAGVLSVKLDSMLLAILAIIGGYGTPVMLSTGSANFIGLYSYMLMLGVGVLGIAWRRNWHLLNFLAFAGTYILVFASLERYYEVDRFWEVMPFLIAFFVLFSSMIFIFQVSNGIKSTLIELLMLMANAGLFFGLSYGLIEDAYSSEWNAVVSLGLAAFYTAHVAVFLQRGLKDRGLSLGFISLAAFFLIVTVPLLLSDQWLTLCWSVQALVMLWLAGKLNSRFLQYVAYLLYVIVFGRFFALDMRTQFVEAIPEAITWQSYLALVGQRVLSFGLPIASVAAAMRLVKHPASTASLAVDDGNDVKEWVGPQRIFIMGCAVAFAMLFLYLHLEINRTMLVLWDPLRLPMLSILWVVSCLLFLKLYEATESKALLVMALLFGAGIVVKLLVVDLVAWELTMPAGRYAPKVGYSFLGAGMRLIDFGSIIAFFVFGYRLFRFQDSERALSRVFGYGSLLLLFVYLSLEFNSFLAHFVPGLRAGGLSVFWGLYALGLVLGGILHLNRALRIVGLALFGVVVAKVLMFDLGHLDPVYKIVAFILLGIVLIGGSFVYLKFESRFRTGSDDTDLQNGESE